MSNIKVIFNDDKNINCSCKEEVVEIIIDDYRENSDTCIGEMLNCTEIQGLSVQDVVDVFAYIMYKIERDEVVQTMFDGENPEKINRWEW